MQKEIHTIEKPIFPKNSNFSSKNTIHKEQDALEERNKKIFYQTHENKKGILFEFFSLHRLKYSKVNM